MSAADWDELAADPLVAATYRLAAALADEAAARERDSVDRAVLDRLATIGLYALGADEARGGRPADAATRRRVAELLAGADPQVWFVWFQHGPVVALLAASENTALADRWLPALCRGQAYAGVAFSHLCSARPSITAEPVAGGWRLHGRQPWCTGWGLIDTTLVGAVDTDQQVLFALLPALDGDGLRASAELPLAAMGATHTVGLTLDGVHIPAGEVVLAMPYDAWRAADEARNANVQPSTFGVALAALDLLAPRAPDLAEELRERVLAVRSAAYRLADDVPAGEQTDRRLGLRAEALLLGMQATTALVASRGGVAMSLDDPAQRLLRAATFQLVHAQNQPVRDATLRRVGRTCTMRT